MSWTQADVDALKQAIASGAQSVTSSDGKSVTYRPQDELMKLLTSMQDEVSASRRQPASFLAGFRRDS